ncbi:hypothetical protein LCGC14_2548210 [marine sediment metagenome]|uniref:Uncharacterized protein n=1 Tax=marine sediment metagenome TaxID=412755 RepID=A0A0F9D029_9ZZZZ
MKIQIVTFAGVPGHVYDAEKHFHTEKVILILSDENKDETNKVNEEFISNRLCRNGKTRKRFLS